MTTETDHKGITMSRPTEDRYARNFLPDNAPSLRTVLEKVEADPALSQRQRNEMRSALRCTGNAIAPGMALEAIPADPARLRQQLSRITAMSLGISEPTCQNRKSLLKRALSHAGIARNQFTIELTGR